MDKTDMLRPAFFIGSVICFVTGHWIWGLVLLFFTFFGS